MTFVIGIDFRNTAGYVTDQTNCYGETGTGNSYPTSEGGTNVGYYPSASGITAIDASSSVDPRLAGFSYNASAITYRIDLPAAGKYVVNLAAGDARGGFNHPGSFTVQDNTTTLLTLNTGIPGGNFLDASGTLYTSAAAWVTANPIGGLGTGSVVLTFTSTICYINWVPATYMSDTNNCLCHFMIQQAVLLTPIIGIDFRQTLAYVTDQTGCYPEVGASPNAYPTSEGGTNVGYTSTSGVTSIDANSSIDTRLAGFTYDSGSRTYRIDLPAAGTYVLTLAAGDARGGFNHPGSFTVQDNTTTVLTLNTGVPAYGFLDASGTLYSGGVLVAPNAANWARANPLGVKGSGSVSVSFASTICKVNWVPASYSGDSNNCLCHFMISAVSSTLVTADLGAIAFENINWPIGIINQSAAWSRGVDAVTVARILGATAYREVDTIGDPANPTAWAPVDPLLGLSVLAAQWSETVTLLNAVLLELQARSAVLSGGSL